MAHVVLDHLSKTFHGPSGISIRAVKDLCFKVEEGELLVLVGPSACGKTTTLRLIAGLEEPTAGQLSLHGQNVNGVPPEKRDVAMVFQNPALYPHMSVYENLAFGLKLRRHPRDEIEKRVNEASEWLELDGCLDRMPDALSGGQRQRVAIGRAVARQPKLLLLDEPLSNLDAPLRAHMRGEIARLQARLGATMIYVTHDQLEAMTLGHRIAVMNEGKIQQTATPSELYRRPVNLFVAGFIGSPPMNLVRGHLAGRGGRLCFIAHASEGRPAADPCEFPLPNECAARLNGLVSQSVILGLRPEDIQYPTTTGARGAPSLKLTVERVERLGSENHLYLATGLNSLVARVKPDECPAVNQPIVVSLNLSNALFFDPATEQAIL